MVHTEAEIESQPEAAPESKTIDGRRQVGMSCRWTAGGTVALSRALCGKTDRDGRTLRGYNLNHLISLILPTAPLVFVQRPSEAARSEGHTLVRWSSWSWSACTVLRGVRGAYSTGHYLCFM